MSERLWMFNTQQSDSILVEALSPGCVAVQLAQQGTIFHSSWIICVKYEVINKLKILKVIVTLRLNTIRVFINHFLNKLKGCKIESEVSTKTSPSQFWKVGIRMSYPGVRFSCFTLSFSMTREHRVLSEVRQLINCSKSYFLVVNVYT